MHLRDPILNKMKITDDSLKKKISQLKSDCWQRPVPCVVDIEFTYLKTFKLALLQLKFPEQNLALNRCWRVENALEEEESNEVREICFVGS